MHTDRTAGIVVAMQSELDHLDSLAWTIPVDTDGPYPAWQGRLGNYRTVVIQSGIGMVNAAAVTERLIILSKPAVLFNFGCAGSHRPDLLPGDIVIGNGVVSHGSLRILPDGTDEHWLPQAESSDATSNPAANHLNADLVSLAERLALQDYHPQPWPADLLWPAGIPRRAPRIVTGIVASADVWSQSPVRLQQLVKRHNSLCEDMEAAAIAQVARRHNLPFLAIKDISNNEFLKASDTTAFADFPHGEVGKRAAGLLAMVIAARDERSIRHIQAAAPPSGGFPGRCRE